MPRGTLPVDHNPSCISAAPIDIALPNETLAAIFEQLTPSTLANISFVSTQFRAVAERLLYANINVADILTSTSPSPRRSLRCCHSILRRPHLAETVKKFHLRWQIHPNEPFDSELLELALPLLRDALRTLTQLESLELYLGPINLRASQAYPGPSIHPIERVVDGLQFPSLRNCSLGAEWAKGVQPYGDILAAFLISLPILRHLRLSDHHGVLHLPPEALPSLSSFRGSPDSAAYLLPGRPVHTLSLVGQDSDVNRTNLPRLTHTTVPLRSLDLSAMSVRPILLQNIASFIPTIEVLKVRLALRHTLHYAMSGIRILAGLSSVLNAFTRLVHLDLSPTFVDTLSHNHLAEEAALCTEWSRACGSLRQISFPSKNDWVLNSLGQWRLVGEAHQ